MINTVLFPNMEPKTEKPTIFWFTDAHLNRNLTNKNYFTRSYEAVFEIRLSNLLARNFQN
jgi:hypothetical protein